MCFHLLTILTSQGHIGKLFVISESPKSRICICFEVIPLQTKLFRHCSWIKRLFAFMKIGSLAFLPRQAAKYLVPAKKKRKFELKHSLAFPFLAGILPFSIFWGGPKCHPIYESDIYALQCTSLRSSFIKKEGIAIFAYSFKSPVGHNI